MRVLALADRGVEHGDVTGAAVGAISPGRAAHGFGPAGRGTPAWLSAGRSRFIGVLPEGGQRQMPRVWPASGVVVKV